MNFLTSFFREIPLTLSHGSKNVTKITELSAKSRHQKGDMQQFQYRGPTILYWPVNHTIIRQFMHNAWKMIYAHIFVSKQTAVMITLKILGTTVPNLIARVTRCPGIVHPCSNLSCHSKIKPSEHVAISCSGLNVLHSVHLYCGNILFRLTPPIFCSLIN